MSIDTSEETYGGIPPREGGPRSVPYLRLVHSSDVRAVREEPEKERNGSFVVAILAVGLAAAAAVFWWLA